MGVKIDTKAYFKVLTVNALEIHANMADVLEAALREGAATAPAHLIVVLEGFEALAADITDLLHRFAGEMGSRRLSFVITGVPAGTARPALAGLNTVNTYQEAVDMVMMEALERELTDDQGDA